MKTRYGIGLIIFISIVLYLSFYTIGENEKSEEVKTEQTIETDGDARKETCYYLLEKNGYVVVVEADKKTPFEYTDILLEDLPDLLQKEIRNGKYVDTKEELYGFLENYSS